MRNTVLAAMFVLLVGCESNNNAKQNLGAGYAALESRQFDDAMVRADAQLRQSPGAGTPEALYLKGRALEQKTVSSSQESRQNLLQARDAYTQALRQQPPDTLIPLIHAGLGNTAYWMDDYGTAANEWSTAYRGFNDPQVTSFMLYRIGICQQRLGQFGQADQTFVQVQQQFPGTDAAKRARDRQGFKSFTVQLATYASASRADAEIASLRRQGVIPAKATNAQGHSVVSIGPVGNYSQAMDLKNRFVGTYPTAIILP